MKALELIYIRHNRNTPAYCIPKKQISYFDLTLVLKGTVTYCIDSQSITLNDGDAILIPPGALRERIESEGNVDYISFNFKTDEKLELPVFISNAVSGDVRLLIASCDEIQRVHLLDYEEPLSHLLAALLLTVKNNLQRRSSHPLVNKIVRYLHENISRKITLDDIAKYTFFSPVYCDSIFKKEMGMSPFQYKKANSK